TSWLLKAQEDLRKCIKDDPNCARCHSGLAAVNWYLGRSDVVLAEGKKALALAPNDLDARVWLSLYHQMRDEYPQAQAYNREQLVIEPFFFPGRINLADNYRQMGQAAEAVSELKKVLDVDARNVYAIQYLTLAYLTLGDLESARKTVESSDTKDRGNYQIRWAWALLLAAEGKHDEAGRGATDDLLQFASVYPNQTVYAAEFYSMLGETSKALDWLERAVRNGDDRGSFFQRDPL